MREVQPVNATKRYRCPGCNHDVAEGVKHVVAWRDGEDDMRRHWHTGCWRRNPGSAR